MQQLTQMIRSRRQFRSTDVQNQISEVYRQEIYGTTSSFLTLQGFSLEGEALPSQFHKIEDGNARVSFEPHSPSTMLIEHLDPSKMGQNKFITANFMKRIDLDSISMIGTDMQAFFM